jgi:hypothetical protein
MSFSKGAKSAPVKSDTPGVGSYNPKGGDDGPGCPMTGARPRGGFGNKENTPGPGAYNPKSNAKKPSTASMAMPKRKRPQQSTPGPGEYTPAPVGGDAPKGAATMPKAPKAKRAKKTPGPGEYEDQRPGAIGAKPGGVPMQGKEPEMNVGERPGPGDYEPQPSAFNGDPKGGPRLRGKPKAEPTSEVPGPGKYEPKAPQDSVPGVPKMSPIEPKEEPEPTPGPGEYDNDLAAMGKDDPRKKGTMGEPSEPKEENAGPGPGAYNPTAHEKPKGGAPNLGPGFDPTAPTPQTVEEPTPGPGAYDAPGDAAPKGGAPNLGPGFDKLDETKKNVPVSVPTPGPGDYSPVDPMAQTQPAALMGPAPKKPKSKAPAPGPGDYDASDPSKPDAPAYGMGAPSKPKKSAPTAGPGAYDPEKTLKVPTYDMGAPSKPKKAAPKPGPGDYDTNDPSKPDAPSYPMGLPRKPKKSAAPQPGPGDYTPVDPAKETTAPAYAMGKPSKPKKSAPQPGPGDYTPVDPVKEGTAPSYPMGLPAKPKKSAAPQPGPGDYTPVDPVKETTAPAYNMGNAPAKKKSSAPKPGPGDYTPVDPVKETTAPAYAMGPAPAKKKSAPPQPGPGDYTPVDPAKETTAPAYAMGPAPAKKKSAAPMSDLPGPGAYELAEPKNNKKMSMGAPFAEPTIVEAPGPGPGAYNVFDPQREPKGSAFTMGVPVTTARAKGSAPPPAPGPGTYAAPDLASGPQYTMGGRRDKKSKPNKEGAPVGAYDPKDGYELGSGPAITLGARPAPKVALSDGPDPGAYDLPGLNKGIGPHFGAPFDENRMHDALTAAPPDTGPGPHEYQYGGALTGKEARAAGFGPAPVYNERETLVVSESPGPADYQAGKPAGEDARNTKFGPGFGAPLTHYIPSTDVFDYDLNGNLYSEQPGPSDYTVPNRTIGGALLLPYHRQGGTSFGARTGDRFDVDGEETDATPAPVDYDVPGTFGADRANPVRDVSGPLFGTAFSRQALAEIADAKETDMPGPADYKSGVGDLDTNLKQPRHLMKGKTIARPANLRDGDDDLPGPGHYEQNPNNQKPAVNTMAADARLPKHRHKGKTFGGGLGHATITDALTSEYVEDDPGPFEYKSTAGDVGGDIGSDKPSYLQPGHRFGRDTRKLGRDDDDDPNGDFDPGMLGTGEEVRVQRKQHASPGPGAYELTQEDMGTAAFKVHTPGVVDMSRGAPRAVAPDEETMAMYETPGPGPAAIRVAPDMREMSHITRLPVDKKKGPLIATPLYDAGEAQSYGLGQRSGRGYARHAPHTDGVGDNVKGGAFSRSRFDHDPSKNAADTPAPDEYFGAYKTGDIAVSDRQPLAWQKGPTFGTAPQRIDAPEDRAHDGEPGPSDTAGVVNKPFGRGGVKFGSEPRTATNDGGGVDEDWTPGPSDYAAPFNGKQAFARDVVGGAIGRSPRKVAQPVYIDDAPGPPDTHTHVGDMGTEAKKTNNRAVSFAPAGGPRGGRAAGRDVFTGGDKETPGPGYVGAPSDNADPALLLRRGMEILPGDTAAGARHGLPAHAARGATFAKGARTEVRDMNQMRESAAVPGPGMYEAGVTTEMHKLKGVSGGTIGERVESLPPSDITPGPGRYNLDDAGYDTAGFAPQLARNQAPYDNYDVSAGVGGLSLQ